MAILILLMLILLSMTNATQRTWTNTTGRVEQFREAREAFESMTHRVSQATLNTYWDYQYSSTTSGTVPESYIRQSELRFISGPNLSGSATSNPPRPGHSIFFQAPLGFVSNSTYQGFNNLLNTWGYYVEFADDSSLPPFVSTLYAAHNKHRYRYRLMEMMEPSDSLSLYQYTSGNGKYQTNQPNNPLYMTGTGAPVGYTGMEWFTVPLGNSSPKRAIADNVIALVILPKLTPSDEKEVTPNYTDASLAPNYTYDSTSIGAASSGAAVDIENLDSKNQLPPVVQVTMVAVDEASYSRFYSNQTTPPDFGLGTLFQNVGDTQNPANAGYAQDLNTLESTLQSKKLNYRVFTTNVSIKGAKWSRAQTN